MHNEEDKQNNPLIEYQTKHTREYQGESQTMLHVDITKIRQETNWDRRLKQSKKRKKLTR